MKEEIYNEQELQKLEEEIRAMGIPYSSNEPDDRYFASFRVRLMDQINAKEKKGIFASIWSWISDSPLRSISLGAGLAGVIISALLLNPSKQEVAKIEPAPKTVEQPVVISQESKQQIASAPETHKTSKSHTTHKSYAQVKLKTNKLQDAANKAGDFASIDARLSGDADEPVNLEGLSAGELRAALEAVESMK
jgi:hypothetical protein